MSRPAVPGRLRRPSCIVLWAILAAVPLVAGCGGRSDAASGTLRLYTSVTQDTVDAVVAGFETANPGVTIDVFRAPTGELAARIAAETREGAVQADVLWLTDPLSIQQYAADGLLRSWTPDGIEAVPEDSRTDTFFGTRVLNLVIVAGNGLAAPPADWGDLSSLDGVVAVPDPAFAGSAFAALAFFASSPEYGMDFYQALRDGGAIQVSSPGDVVSGVAEGLYAAGVTLDRLARDAVKDGSPISLIWPDSGAIAIYSPIAVVDASSAEAAEPFVDYVLSTEAQVAIAATGWQPIRTDVEWSSGGEAQQAVDWQQAFSKQDALLADYRSIFGQ